MSSAIQETLQLLARDRGLLADAFLRRLDMHAPQLRTCMPEDPVALQVALDGIIRVVGSAAKTRDTREACRVLGRRFRNPGPAELRAISRALSWAIEQTLGDAFSQPLKLAWSSHFAWLCGEYIEQRRRVGPSHDLKHAAQQGA